MTWTEQIDYIASLSRQSASGAAISSSIAGKLGLPYFQKADIEELLLIESQQILREIHPRALMAMGALAAATVTSNSGVAAIPANTIKVIDVTIDDGPADEISLAGYYQRKNITSRGIPVYAFSANGLNGDGQILYTGGTNMKALFLIEPPLADWQSNVAILPPGIESEITQRVLLRMAITN